MRPLTLDHPLGRLPALAPIFNRGPYLGAATARPSRRPAVRRSKPGGNPTAIASLRAVIDVGNWEDSRFILPGGQSGDPFSPHYDDMVPLWLKGEGVPIAFSPIEVGFAAQHTFCA